MEMRASKPSIKQVLVKLNEGVSGAGNALVDLTGLPPAGDSKERSALEDRLRAMQFELAGITYDSYMKKLQERKGIVEERIAERNFEVQASSFGSLHWAKLNCSRRTTSCWADHQAKLPRMHVPADSGYASLITREAAKVGKRLAKEGVIGGSLWTLSWCGRTENGIRTPSRSICEKAEPLILF
jgi:hypothetical protein